MAEPLSPAVPGAPSSRFNGKISNSELGSLYVMVDSITQNVSVTSVESHASRVHTFYPKWVSQGSFALSLVFRDRPSRDRASEWLRDYMDKMASNSLKVGWLTISVPVRRFTRKGVVEGDLSYGDGVSQEGRAYTLGLTFTGTSDPTYRAGSSRVQHSRDMVVMRHHPSGVQVGWGAGPSFDNPGQAPVFRPGDSNRPV